jgi:hypothetical protein
MTRHSVAAPLILTLLAAPLAVGVQPPAKPTPAA